MAAEPTEVRDCMTFEPVASAPEDVAALEAF